MSKNKILAFDFDGVLCRVDWPHIGKVSFINKIMIHIIKRYQKKGWYLIMNTCREGRYSMLAKLHCYKHGVFPDKINNNAQWLIDKFGDCRKISADIYIDDHNFGLIGALLRWNNGRN